MEKTAQERGWRNELRELINKPGAYFEGFFKPEKDRIMASLSALDDKIRAILTGKQIGQAPAPEDGRSAKDLLKSARRNFNRREYVPGLTDLGLFHQKMAEITQDIGTFRVDVDKIHHKFLFQGLDEQQRAKLQKFREYMERKAESDAQEIIKEAGLMDFFYNTLSKRGLGLAAWEKAYPEKTKKLREGGFRLLDAADGLLDKTIAYLKKMATARAIRRPDDYLDAVAKIKSEFDRFDSGGKGFRAYYNEVVTPILADYKPEEEAKVAPVQPPAPPTGQAEPPPSPPSPPTPPSSPTTPTTPSMGGPPGALPPLAPPPPDTEKSLPPTMEPAKKFRIAHEDFYKSLEAMSEEDPRILVGYISKYAASIQRQDPDTAIRLFELVRQIKG
jgi:hypothetical protein